MDGASDSPLDVVTPLASSLHAPRLLPRTLSVSLEDCVLHIQLIEMGKQARTLTDARTSAAHVPP